jgi:hypothetical protein
MSGGSRSSVSGSSDDDCADLDLTWLSVLLNLSFSRRYRTLIVRYCVSTHSFILHTVNFCSNIVIMK